jgi:hypothetical protein
MNFRVHVHMNHARQPTVLLVTATFVVPLYHSACCCIKRPVLCRPLSDLWVESGIVCTLRAAREEGGASLVDWVVVNMTTHAREDSHDPVPGYLE